MGTSHIQLVVTCAVIVKDGKYLLTQRPGKRHNPFRWEFPGGQVKHGEDLRTALDREVLEEMGIIVKSDRLVEYSSHVYKDDNRHVILFGFIANYISGDIQLHDIKDYKWLTLEEMDGYDITEADLPIIERLKKEKIMQ